MREHFQGGSGRCFDFTATSLMNKLHAHLLETGVPAAEIHLWTSHCFRRGSGVDMLEDKGIRAMVDHGEWSSARAAEPYASSDEQRAVALAAAALCVDDSDDDLD